MGSPLLGEQEEGIPGPRYSECGLQTSSISISWGCVRHTDSQPHPVLLYQNLPFNKIPR